MVVAVASALNITYMHLHYEVYSVKRGIRPKVTQKEVIGKVWRSWHLTDADEMVCSEWRGL